MPAMRSNSTGFRALIVLGLSVLCVLVLQHLPGLDSYISKTTSLPTVAKSAGPVQKVVDVSKRIATPFGDPDYNFSSSVLQEPAGNPDLAKRAITITYNQAKCRGERFRDMIKNAKTDARSWTMNDLKPNGWGYIDPVDPFEPIKAVQTALTKYGVVDPPESLPHLDVWQEFEFVNSRGETKQARGLYDNVFDVRSGSIIALNNFSPATRAQDGRTPKLTKEELALEVPELNRWSDVVWVLWKNEAQGKASTLRNIFRDNVVNDDTKFIMEEIIARNTKTTIPPGTLQLDCCNHSFDINSDDGAALMGTPHGTGTAYFLIDHPEELGPRHVFITMFTGIDDKSDDPADHTNKYFLVFELLF